MMSFLITVVLAVTAVQSCDISPKVSLPLPSNNQTAFTKPNGSLTSIFLAVGVRNHTCTTAGEHMSDGVIGNLYDMSCYTRNPQLLKTIQDKAYKEWKGNSSTILTPLSSLAHLLRGNLFSENSSTGIRLVLDYGETVKNPESYVVADLVVSVPSPSGPGNVDWSQLKGDSALATKIYQTDTTGGSPHGSCKPGSTSEEKFSATFWLYGSASPNTTLPTSFTNDTPIALPSNIKHNMRDVVTPTTDVNKPHTVTKTKTQTKHHTSTKTKTVVKHLTKTDAYISITTFYNITATVTQTIDSTVTNVTTKTSFTTPTPASTQTIISYALTSTIVTVYQAPRPPANTNTS